MTWGIFATVILVGLFVGSFINVVIYRGPAEWGLVDDSRGTLAKPRSYCPKCHKPIDILGLMPLIGFAMRRGKCKDCQQSISIRYPIVETLGAGVIAVCLWRFGLGVEFLLASIFGWTLLALAFVDGETGYLPDALTLPLIVSGIAFNTVDLFAPWPAAIFGALAGYGAFWLVSAGFQKLRGYEGLGMGDAKLLSAIGAWVGWHLLPATVFFAAAVTLLVVFARSMPQGGVSGKQAAPFGPGLAAAGFAALIWSTF